MKPEQLARRKAKVKEKELKAESSIQEKIEALAKLGMSQRVIGIHVGISQPEVCHRLKGSGIVSNPVLAKVIREGRADKFAIKGNEILEAMDADTIAGAGLKDQAIALNILHGAERLELGKSTQNIATYAHRMKEQATEEEEIKRIEAEIVARETAGAE